MMSVPAEIPMQTGNAHLRKTFGLIGVLAEVRIMKGTQKNLLLFRDIHGTCIHLAFQPRQ